MTFKAGDVIEIKECDDVEYTVTKPGTKWLVYWVIDEDLVRVGTLSHNEKKPKEMIESYGRQYSRLHTDRRIRDNVRMFTVRTKDCQPVGNNSIFKHVLSQGDMWKESDNQRTWSRGKARYTQGIDWDEMPF